MACLRLHQFFLRFIFLFILLPATQAQSTDMFLGIAPQPASNGWDITLHQAICSNAYTLVASPDFSAGSWTDTAVIQAKAEATLVATVGTPSPESARFFKVRESSLEDFDEDGLNNRAEFDAGSNPVQGDTDGDLFTDYEEVVLNETNPTLPGDGAEAIEDTRRLILSKWALLYSTPPVFTNRPGSPADLVDLEMLLRQMSGVFFTFNE